MTTTSKHDLYFNSESEPLSSTSTLVFMMKLLDLPLDCFRLLMGMVADNVGTHELLTLRLVSRTMDIEVMHAIETAQWLQHPRLGELANCPPCHPLFRKKLPISPSYVDFIASFVFVRPHIQDPWNANISSFLNHVVDELLREDGLDINHGSRKELLHKLCHQLFEMKHWKQRTHWFTEALEPDPAISIQTETLSHNVMLARVLSGGHISLPDLCGEVMAPKKSSVFGTFLDVCVKSGQIDLVTLLLQSGCDLNDEVHSVLEMAVERPDADMLRTILAPHHGFTYTGIEMKECIMKAIENDRTETTLYLLHKVGSSVFKESEAFRHCREACNRGNLAVVKAMIDELDIVDFETFVNSENHPVQYAAFYGHKHIIQYLFNKGAPRESLAIRATAITGDISMTRFLYDEGVRVHRQLMEPILRVATTHATPRHFEWTCAVIEEFFPPELVLQSACYDLVQYACIHGNLGMLRLLIKGGMNINEVPDLDIPPVVVALGVSRPDVADALVAMGAHAIDPLKSSAAEDFRSGWFPKRGGELKKWPFKARRVCEKGVLSFWDDFE